MSVVWALPKVGISTKTTNKLSDTTLHMAVARENLETVKVLLGAAADLHGQNGSGDVPLCLAVYRSNDTVVRVMLENGAPIEAENSTGKTAMQYASSQKNG